MKYLLCETLGDHVQRTPILTLKTGAPDDLVKPVQKLTNQISQN